jgi:hypothetical protein
VTHFIDGVDNWKWDGRCICGIKLKGRKNKKYCSNACKQRAYRERHKPVVEVVTGEPLFSKDAIALVRQVAPIDKSL